eukprot:1161905-Pelagomonas_calceolata.AAC.3
MPFWSSNPEDSTSASSQNAVALDTGLSPPSTIMSGGGTSCLASCITCLGNASDTHGDWHSPVRVLSKNCTICAVSEVLCVLSKSYTIYAVSEVLCVLSKNYTIYAVRKKKRERIIALKDVNRFSSFATMLGQGGKLLRVTFDQTPFGSGHADLHSKSCINDSLCCSHVNGGGTHTYTHAHTYTRTHLEQPGDGCAEHCTAGLLGADGGVCAEAARNGASRLWGRLQEGLHVCVCVCV